MVDTISSLPLNISRSPGLLNPLISKKVSRDEKRAISNKLYIIDLFNKVLTLNSNAQLAKENKRIIGPLASVIKTENMKIKKIGMDLMPK